MASRTKGRSGRQTRPDFQPLNGTDSQAEPDAESPKVEESVSPEQAGIDPSRVRTILDILYCDRERFASYYSQVFAGRVVSVERHATSRSTTENFGQGIIGGIGASRKGVSETNEGYKHVRDPHDQTIIDVLNFFVKKNLFAENIFSAHSGELVNAQGALNFLGSDMTKGTFSLLTNPGEMGKMAASAADLTEESLMGLNLMNEIFSSTGFPNVFSLELFSDDDGPYYMPGVVDPGFMKEPISSYYFRHGAGGLPDISVVGIKEVSDERETADVDNFFTIARSFAQVVKYSFLPQRAIRITPLLIFREIYWIAGEETGTLDL